MSKSSFFIKNLSLTNFATFENQTVDFDSKFNVIIGETGSGKSIIFDDDDLNDDDFDFQPLAPKEQL